MPRGGPLIVEDFIIPALERQTYGQTLKWVDRDVGLFQLTLMHMNNAQWCEDYTKVYEDWDMLKGRLRCTYTGRGYLTDAKQRFKNALRKCRSLVEAPNDILMKFGIQKRKQTLFYVYNKNDKVLKIGSQRKGGSQQMLQSIKQEPCSDDSKEAPAVPYDLVKRKAMPISSDAFVETRSIGAGKQQYICIKLPTNFNPALSNDGAKGLVIKVNSNGIDCNTITLLEDETHKGSSRNSVTQTSKYDTSVVYPCSIQEAQVVPEFNDNNQFPTAQSEPTSHHKDNRILPYNDDSFSDDDDDHLVVDCDSPKPFDYSVLRTTIKTEQVDPVIKREVEGV